MEFDHDPTASNETKRFLGERYDADAGLQYLNARYYDPKLAMFIQPDWFEVAKAGVGTNRYAYSHNDPVNKMDPGGNSFWSDLGQSLRDTWSAIRDTFSGNVTRISNAGQPGTNGSYGTVHVNGTTYGCFGCGGGGNASAQVNTATGYAWVLANRSSLASSTMNFTTTLEPRAYEVPGGRFDIPASGAFGAPAGAGLITGMLMGLDKLFGADVQGAQRSNASPLAKALYAAGFVRGPNQDAHHIVAKRAAAALPARITLDNLGIGIDSAENGVFVNRAQHQRMHTGAYYRAVNLSLRGVKDIAIGISVLNGWRVAIHAGFW